MAPAMFAEFYVFGQLLVYDNAAELRLLRASTLFHLLEGKFKASYHGHACS